MSGWQVQDLDLTGREDVLAELDPRGALFLGCTIPERDRRTTACRRSPAVPGGARRALRPVARAACTRRPSSTTGLEKGYDHTTDARVYAWSRTSAKGHDLRRLLAAALHDRSIDDALDEFIRRRRIVGVMGGHELTRDDPAYAAAAHLGPRPRRAAA